MLLQLWSLRWLLALIPKDTMKYLCTADNSSSTHAWTQGIPKVVLRDTGWHLGIRYWARWNGKIPIKSTKMQKKPQTNNNKKHDRKQTMKWLLSYSLRITLFDVGLEPNAVTEVFAPLCISKNDQESLMSIDLGVKSPFSWSSKFANTDSTNGEDKAASLSSETLEHMEQLLLGMYSQCLLTTVGPEKVGAMTLKSTSSETLGTSSFSATLSWSRLWS